MQRADLKELHYITPITNLKTIQTLGILSHNRVSKIHHDSIAKQEVQERRANRKIPNGLYLHDYVNLYFNARNPMMFLRQDEHLNICVLRISTNILNLKDVVLSDMNAAKDFVLFAPSPGGLAKINSDLVFAQRWNNHPTPQENDRHKGIMCAEVLVPKRVDPSFIVGVYASCPQAKEKIEALELGVAVTINGRLFFR